MANNYTRTAIALHWLVGALVIIALTVGWIMTDMATSPLKAQVFSWHKWIGVTVLGLMLVRVLWRLTHPAPAPLPMSRWQQLAAQALTGLLYLMLFLQPLSGWMFSNAAGRKVVYLGLVPLPNLVGKDKALADTVEGIHNAGAVIIAIVVGLHALASLKHHFVDRDDTLRRMLRWRTS
jgi:cytochrome b561